MASLIYEAVNRTLHEILVGVSRLSLEQLRALHLKSRIAELASWDFATHKIEYREVERDLPDRDVPTFLDGYARSVRRAGWTMKVTSDGWLVRKPPSDGEPP